MTLWQRDATEQPRRNLMHTNTPVALYWLHPLLDDRGRQNLKRQLKTSVSAGSSLDKQTS